MAQLDRADAEALDGALVVAALDVLADPESIVEQVEHAGDDVADKILRTKADRDAEDAQTGNQRADFEAHRRQGHQRCGGSDIDRARKLIKQIGLDLAKDPEFAPLILEPLKMQGVDALGDFAVQIRMKMMTLPGENFVIRRQALAMIKKAFDANGIKFAFPTVQIAGDGEPSTAAVAQRALELTRPAAAAAE